MKLGIVAVGLLGMSAAWAANVYTRSKGDYNALHCYYAIVPLLTYLFFRNISKTFRNGVSQIAVLAVSWAVFISCSFFNSVFVLWPTMCQPRFQRCAKTPF